MNRRVDIMCDTYGREIVVIQDIRFRGKRNIDWNEVEEYLKSFVEDFYTIIETNDLIYIGKDLPDEYTGSKYTHTLKGSNAKAKANAAQGIPELIQISKNKRFKKNLETKHDMNAKYGWYRYDSRFALPVYDECGETERFNVFDVEIVIRHDANGKMYLYDILNIKKETSNPLGLMRTVKTHFLILMIVEIFINVKRKICRR